MTVSGTFERDTAPFKLEHDITPRDTVRYGQADGSLLHNKDFRYKGYPGENFDHERPIAKPPVEGELDSPRYHGVGHWLDTRKPLYAGDPPKGLQYGSNGAPISEHPTDGPPRPRKPLKEKTTAELDKFRRLQMEVDADIAKFREDRQRRIVERETEKKDDLQMLKNYDPWGKPGAGAPFKHDDGGARRRSPAQPEGLRQMEQEYGNFYSNFGRPGGGAPLRTESGKVKAEMKTSDDIRFQDSTDGQLMTDRYVRYKNADEHKQHYHKDLEKQWQEKHHNSKELRIQELKSELDMIKHDPFGKPGAGAPNSQRAYDGSLTSGRRATLSADLVEMRKIERKEKELGLGQNSAGRNSDPEHAVYDPWGKGYGAPTYDEFGQVKRYKFANKDFGIVTSDPNEDKMNSLPIERGAGGAGAPVRNEKGEQVTKMPQTMKSNRAGVIIKEETGLPYQKTRPGTNDPDKQLWAPWGAPGGGAPRCDERTGELITQRPKQYREESADVHQKNAAKQVYLHELQRQQDDNRTSRDAQTWELKNGGGDLASVMREGKVGRPRRDPETGILSNNALTMSDVTKGKTDVRSQKDHNSSIYHTELETQAEERRRGRMIEKVKEQQESKNHQRQFDTFWGKPGAGAPKETNKKTNLDNILHTPRKENSNYNLATPWASSSEPVF